MSAWFSPICGRATLPDPLPSALSILTTSAGRFRLPGSVATNPVSGYTGGGALVVVTIEVLVVVVVDAVFFPPPQADRSASATTTVNERRIIDIKAPEVRQCVRRVVDVCQTVD